MKENINFTSTTKNILIVVGTRPNFIKITQFKKVAKEHFKQLDIKVVHTGQHYDQKMADVFFNQFDLHPDFFLNISTTLSANYQMAEIMINLEKLITNNYKPDLLVVVGDVNSTLAASITANKLNIPLAHVESGLRSYDRTMPEEINRILTDQLCDYFFITEQSGWDNLIKEGVDKGKLHFVGNTMIDTLVAFEDQLQDSKIMDQLNLQDDNFTLMTIHRPANVDNKEGLEKLIELINHISQKSKIVFPIHPRTINKLKQFGLFESLSNNKNIIISEPLDYFAFQKLIFKCQYILTDSGGIQEESTFRKKPCLTIRPNTERPSTISLGTNTLVEWDIASIKNHIGQIENGTYKKGEVPIMWDGKATYRILESISKLIV